MPQCYGRILRRLLESSPDTMAKGVPGNYQHLVIPNFVGLECLHNQARRKLHGPMRITPQIVLVLRLGLKSTR